MDDNAYGLQPGAWMESVSELLRLPPRAPQPFTLGEAVAELGLWASTARDDSWKNASNRSSLARDIDFHLDIVGPRLRASLSDLLPSLATDTDRATVAIAAADFAERWQRRDTIDAAFRDLCEAASTGSLGVWDLKPMAELISSQLGDAGRDWGLLSNVRTVLSGDPHGFQLEGWLAEGAGSETLTPTIRLDIARNMLTAEPPTGRVVVWLLFDRAQVNARVAAGPITFLLSAWAIPNATRDDGQHFPERDELRAMMADSSQFREDDLVPGDLAGENFVLVRVDLGQRSAAGAAEEATRRVDALLSIAIEAGGVSWLNTGTSATLVDGQERMSTSGAIHRRDGDTFHDSYGIRVTSELLTDWAARLDAVLRVGPMPAFLVEALSSVREASMMDHRDVLFYNARPVTPRVALALEDHAIELIASLAQLHPERLVTVLQQDEADHRWSQMLAGGLVAPLDTNRKTAKLHDAATSLTQSVSRTAPNGVRVVALEKVWEVRDQLRALPVSPAAEITRDFCLAAISSTSDEEVGRERAKQAVELLRTRHRRVRNAIAHGNPVTPVAIGSVREFSQRVTRQALAIALHAHATGTDVSSYLAGRSQDRDETNAEVANGVCMLDRIGNDGSEAAE